MRGNVLLLLMLFVCGSLAFFAPSVAHAATLDELKQKIANKTEEIKNLEEEIKKYQEQIGVLGFEKTTLKKLIDSLDLTRKKLETELRITKVNVETTGLQIDQLGSKISVKEKEIGSRRDSLAEMIRLDWPEVSQVYKALAGKQWHYTKRLMTVVMEGSNG
jgi:septal ring factor EnvC (AmiA/AmiB activator)